MPEENKIDTEEELQEELKKEKLIHEIQTLRTQTIEVWVKEIKSIGLLLIFVGGTIANGIHYFLNLVHNKKLEAIPVAPSLEGSAEALEAPAMAMASMHPQFGDIVSGLMHNNMMWQIVLFAVLIPLVLDWMKKNKEKKGADSNASTNNVTSKE
jgi:hypothetical protein